MDQTQQAKVLLGIGNWKASGTCGNLILTEDLRERTKDATESRMRGDPKVICLILFCIYMFSALFYEELKAA